MEIIPPDLTLNSFIDFGCGNGVFLDTFSRRKGCRGIGIDISGSMIDSAPKRFAAHRFMVGDIDTLSNENLNADIIFFNDVIEHLKKPDRYLLKAATRTKYIGIRVPLEKTWLIGMLNTSRLKKPVSRLYHTEGHLHEWSKGDLYALIEKAGLTVLFESMTMDGKPIVYHPYIRENMRQKPGLQGRIRYSAYCLMEQIPYSLTRTMLRPLKGSTQLMLCKVKEKPRC